MLGDGVNQAGSLVDEDRLRFDFNYFEPMTKEQLQKVEDMVNEAILSDYETEVSQQSLDEAKRLGAKALFTEKYDDEVRAFVFVFEVFVGQLRGGCRTGVGGRLSAACRGR